MKAANKNTMREITKTKSRFLSILLICAIGVGFFSGVRAASGDMRVSADDYYDSHNLFDLRVVSTFGLTDGDLEAIESIDGVDGAYVSRYTDLSMYCGEKEYITRVYSETPEEINRIDISEGRIPQAEDEAIVDGTFGANISIGDTVTLEDPTDADEFPLKRREYTIVGMYHTPMFIDKTHRGSTNIGDGVIDSLMIVSGEQFTQEPYTEIYIRSDKLKDEKSYSNEYERLRDEISEKLETLGEERSEIRYGEVLGDALQEIEDGETELADAKADGQKELDDALKKLEDAKQQIADGEKELEDAKAKLDDAKPQLDDAEKQLSDARKQLDDAKAELDKNKPVLDEAKETLDASLKEITDGETRLAQAKTQLDETAKQLAEAEQQLVAQKAQLEQLGAMMPPEQLAAAREQIAAAETQLTQGKAMYEAGLAEYNENAKRISDGRAAYESGLAEYQAGLAEYNAGLEKYNSGEADYQSGFAEFQTKKAEYENGVTEYNKGVEDIEQAKKDCAQGEKDYEDGKSEFETKIADAEKELADAREKIADAGEAKWYVFTRDDNSGYSEYDSNAERISRIAAIFPVFFLLVAGLVCLTTMSRMVEEQRTQIGTLKALGYSRGAIMRHYMTYAVTAALIGGILGAIGGCFLFPGVIVFAYSMMYRIVDIHFMFTADNLILSIGSMTLAIAATVYFSCGKALKETPASLMRPKAPKAGKRIFLEKIPFIWNKMNFFAKVSARNLIRYKRRMIMTIVGIAGCTALSLTGFGLKNSINDIVDLQYNDIYRYSGYAAFDEDIKPSELESVYKSLTDYEPDTDYTRALIKQYDLEFSGNTVPCYITAAEDSELFGTFVDMRERVSRKPLSMSGGAVITEKAAKLLGAKTGDEITVKVSEGDNKKVTISGITEQYTGHYLYLSESLYEETFGQAPKYNMVYFNNGISRDDDVQEKFTAHMLENENILAVIMNASSLASIFDTLKIMDLVVLVLIASAAALAFVVLYNLTNVNITERIREIATLKVLGFYDLEVSSYVFRESIVLSLVGALAGLGLGYALCMFVITTAELDEMMFGRNIHATSYLLAFLVTAAFSLIVNLIMTKVLKKVSMVESLKSVE